MNIIEEKCTLLKMYFCGNKIVMLAVRVVGRVSGSGGVIGSVLEVDTSRGEIYAFDC